MGGHDGGGARRGHRRRAISGSGRRATPWARHLPAARRRRRAGDVGRCPARQRDGHRVDRSSVEQASRGRLRAAVADDDQRQSVGTAILSAPRLSATSGAARCGRQRPQAEAVDPNAQDVRALAPWSELRPDPIAAARHGYAEELRCTASIREPAVVKAFATVPREHFLGPGPWRILSPMSAVKYWTTDNADPRHLYHDVLVAIDEKRRLNNGQPSLWANLYDQLGLTQGSHVVHVGAGTGYYSAVLAEIVGSTGRVSAIELDPSLAARARENLAPVWPQAKVIATDGFGFRPEQPADAVIVNAGVTHISPAWLDVLAAEGGRLLVPLTNAENWGGFLLITRHAGETRHYRARFVHHVGIVPCIGGRDPEAESRLKEALSKAPMTAVQSLRRAPEEPDASCWLAGDGWWLSTVPVLESGGTRLPSV